MPVTSEAAADVAIIGAGPAGLTAAYLLTKAGYSAIVIEKDPVYVGGISRTVEHEGFRFDIGGHRFFSKAREVVDHQGFRFDIGGHRFFSKSREVVDLWNEILPDDFIQRPRMSRIFYDGKFYSYPLRGFEALRNLGIWRSTCCMASYAYAQLFPNKDVKSFQDWTINQFGQQLFNIFFKTYTEKVWGMPCDEISADWAAQRIKGLSLGGAVIDGLKRSLGLNKRPNDGMETKTLLETFRYPRKGPGMMWDAARDFVVEHGNKVLMSHALQQLSFDDKLQRWRVAATNGDGKTVIIKASHVISSAPIRELVSRISSTATSSPWP
jgi:protoporphyrinogen oxidase